MDSRYYNNYNYNYNNGYYPMTFTQAPSVQHQKLIYYNGKPYLQGLDINRGPVMFPVRPLYGSQCFQPEFERPRPDVRICNLRRN